LLQASGIGALIASAYGIIHDQITYTISPEYFTEFKFEQFAFADFALVAGERGFVVVIGVLATWWVGLIAGWFLRRLAIFPDGSAPPVSDTVRHFKLIVITGAICGIAGNLIGRVDSVTRSTWSPWMESLDDPAAFHTVGQIHNFGYLGALLGLIMAGVSVRLVRNRTIAAQKNAG